MEKLIKDIYFYGIIIREKGNIFKFFKNNTMSKITKEQFLKDVVSEVKNIKKHATRGEIDRLNLKTFDPLTPTTCIYGQMTYDCRSDRAL